jgi:GntR family transcriptional regulator
MFFTIDPSNGLPIYEQIVRNVKFAIAREAVRPGELVPSVRELARELAVNPNTVARAYRDLQSEGVLDAVRGTGLAVAREAPAQCRADRPELIRARLRQALVEAKQSRLDGKELRTIIEEEFAQLSDLEDSP